MALILRNLEGAVYGTIAVGALLAVESARQETYLKTIAAVVITQLLYWLAHSYSDLAASRLRSGGQLTVSGLARMMVEELPILIGAAIPLLVLLIFWAGGASLTGAINAAIWTSAAIILVIELAAGIRARLAPPQLIVQALAGALLGSLIIALRGILH